MQTSKLSPRVKLLAGGAALMLASGAVWANTAAPAAPAAKAADVKVAQASPNAPAQRAATAMKRNAQGQIESTETRNWSAIDKNGDNLISPDEMQAYLEASRR